MAAQQANKKKGAAMVVGAGVAGMQASLDLANSGYLVYLVDKSPTIGGIMAQLDKTFPTNDCAMCIISPKLVEVGRHLNIDIITNSEIDAIEGEAGNFTVTLKSQPRYIDLAACTACGQCRSVCPATAVNEFNERLDLREATYMRYPQAIPRGFAIDRSVCIGCGLCEKVCLAEAIHYDDQPKTQQVEVGSVILAAGNDVFDPGRFDTYNYINFPNVVTSLEFERILSASGPYRGHLMRPYDREEPKKIAWLQCVGSRNINACDNSYCSAVCCMYAIKEAVIAKEHAHHGLDTAIFFMDMRTYGKEFEQYYNRAQEHGVRFIRSRVHSIEPEGDCDLRLSYTDEKGNQHEEVFDMVVLSVGFEVGQQTIEMARKLGIDLNKHNFAVTDGFMPVATSRPGIYVCGTLQAPKDIPQSVMEASGAAAGTSALLSESRYTLTRTRELPAERDVTGEEPRIGVFVCNCGINIGGFVDVPAVREYARTLPHVVHVEDNLFTCSQDTQVRMGEVIKEKGINRMVVAACTPLTHEALFRETLLDIGLNKYLFDMANIRNQDSWVHMNDKDKATDKAKDLVRMAVARSALLKPLQEKKVEIKQSGLVVGGGIAGMNAALNLAQQGYDVAIVEKGVELGGLARLVSRTIEGLEVQPYIEKLIADVNSNERIKVFTNAKVALFKGYKGNFTTKVLTLADMKEHTIQHGVAIVATGAQEYKPKELGYGQEGVMTQLELDHLLHHKANGNDPSKWERVVMIQCVGSRNEENPNCSRICCQSAVKHALQIKEINPEADVYILYRDMRMYGMLEDYYTEARRKGIVFSRFDLDQPPEVSRNGGGLEVTFVDHVLQRPVKMKADAVVLSAATLAAETDELATQLKVPRNAFGYFIEAHAKLRPVDFSSEGIYLCGTAHAPKLISETITQALAAASRATSFLAGKFLSVGGAVAHVDQSKCAACLVCVMSCPYGIPQINENNVSEINEALCQGCGVCVSECPAKVIQLSHYEDDQILENVEALLEGVM
ncbi:MAG: CoB--CoM heterodisulfide reductase iron-sulfur subunit A family protein [Syntrophobacteraceae bacterium]|jgi:heterodisulfide reductase subunit A|nr:CoB--CoM heterodisulfide reductase iron-sulfur subunit A family protein [Syntrophobacteraceae bacterium]